MKFPNQIQNKRVVLTMVALFLIYNFFVYTQGTENGNEPLSELALKGENLFQQNNCLACHQLYGLGGYLGPDLTNIISAENKGPTYVNAFINSGIKSMPKYDFTEQEKEAIVQFLTEVDQTGFYPNYDADKKLWGWIDLKYKNE